MMATNTGPLIVPARPTGPAVATVAVTNDIRPIKPPVPISNPWVWLWWGLALALVAGAVAGALWWRQKKRLTPPPVPVVPPHLRARQRLAEALLHLSDPRRFCIEVSDAVRVYLEERFEFHAPDRTTDEFLVELQDTHLLSSDQKASLGEFLQSCDLVKFAKHEPTEQALRELHESACRLVDETRFERVTAPGVAEAPAI
jgi:hypothetical protein